MTRDPKFAHCVSRSANIEEIYAELSAIMVSWPTSEWQTLLDAADIPNAPLNTPVDILPDPQIKSTGFIAGFEHPTEGLLHIMRIPTQWSGTPLPRKLKPAPRSGEHTKIGRDHTSELQSLMRISYAVFCLKKNT